MQFIPRQGHAHRAPRRTLSLLLCLLVVAPLAPAGSYAARQDEVATADEGAPKKDAAEFVPGEALVRFRGEKEAEAGGEATTVEIADPSAGVLAGFGPKRRVTARFRRFDGSDMVAGLRLVKLTADGAAADRKQTLAAISALGRRPDVLYAEPNYIWRAKATPNDSFFNQQYAMPLIGATSAWDTTTGSKSVVVAVLDGGVNLQHPDLAPNAWVNPLDSTFNGVDEDSNGFTDDVNGWDFTTCNSDSPDTPAVCGNNVVFDGQDGDDHGTHVAGTIGARGNNGAGVAGVNWQVSLMSVKVLGPDGGDTADIIRGYNYVRRMRVEEGVNVRVTNNSYGGSDFSLSARDAIRALDTAGILVVAAAGNDSRDTFTIPEFPANYDSPNVIAVASTNSADSLSGFSNFSSRLVSIGAPGTGILSTIPTSGFGGNAANPYANFSGTSMASPHVAGAAALVCSAIPGCRDSAAVNSGISVAHLRGALAFNGDRIPALETNTTTGRRLNVRAAIDAALEADATAPAQTALTVVSQSGRSLTLGFTAPGDDGLLGTASDFDFYFVNSATGLRVLLPTSDVPATGGTQQSVVVNTPFGNLNGSVELVAYDNRGNQSVSTLAVQIQQNPSTDPYVVAQSAAEALSAGGTRLNVNGDDKYSTQQALPFAFPFFNQSRTAVTVSSNGVLYFSTPPRRDNGDADDVPSSVNAMQGQTMIAGLWDDLEIDTTKRADAGIFVVQEFNRVIYRWQATTFPTPLSTGGTRGVHPVNFEVELRSDGTIVFRYGAGNQNLFPVAGISGGEPTAYVVASHTSEDALRDLTNAPSVTFGPRPSGPQVFLQFNSASLAQSEGAARAEVTVTRTGDVSGVSTVEYTTADADTFTVGCADAAGAAGAAFARCDFATSVGTLTFAATEVSKTLSVPLIDDGHDEGSETFQLRLSSPVGAQLGTPNAVTITIIDNDAAGAPNPVLGPPHDFFVRQQYLDFLSREPDAGGFNAWLGVLNGCQPSANTGPEVASGCDRIHVSGEGFFRSDEFLRLKGGYAFRFYKVAFNRLPEYTEIVSDMSFVAGATAQEVFARRAELAARFAARPEFAQLYGGMTDAQYVNALLGRYNLTQVTTPDPANPETGAKVVLTAAALAALPRDKALRAVADSDEVGAAEFNNTFVAMQYYGYLRRKPDPAGFEAWLKVLQSGDVRTMVNGFLNSAEYRLRFGQQ